MNVVDRLIVSAAALPAVLGFGAAIAITHDVIVAGLVGTAACIVAAGISLTPPVKRARMRLFRQKYPDAS